MKKNTFHVNEILFSVAFLTLFFISPHLQAQYTVSYDLKTVEEGSGAKGEEKLHNAFEKALMRRVERDESYTIKVFEDGSRETTIQYTYISGTPAIASNVSKTVIDGKSIKSFDKSGTIIFQQPFSAAALKANSQTIDLSKSDQDKFDETIGKRKIEADDLKSKGAKSKIIKDGAIHFRDNNREFIHDYQNIRFEEREFEGKDLKHSFHQKFQKNKNGHIIPQYAREINMERNKQGNRVWHFSHQYYTNYKVTYPSSFRSIDESNNKTESSNKLTVYPNPSTKLIYVRIPDKIFEDSPNIIVTDIMGKIVFEQKAQYALESIDISNFVTGVYIINVETEANEKFTERFIKQ